MAGAGAVAETAYQSVFFVAPLLLAVFFFGLEANAAALNRRVCGKLAQAKARGFDLQAVNPPLVGGSREVAVRSKAAYEQFEAENANGAKVDFVYPAALFAAGALVVQFEFRFGSAILVFLLSWLAIFILSSSADVRKVQAVRQMRTLGSAGVSQVVFKPGYWLAGASSFLFEERVSSLTLPMLLGIIFTLAAFALPLLA